VFVYLSFVTTLGLNGSFWGLLVLRISILVFAL